MFKPTSSTQSVRDLFEDQGYLIVPKLMGNDIIENLFDDYAEIIDRLAHQLYSSGRLPDLYQALPFLERATIVMSYLSGKDYQHLDIALPSSGEINENSAIHLSEAIFNMLAYPPLLDIVEELIGPEIQTNPLQHVRIKVPESLLRKNTTSPSGLGVRTGWHQDQGSVLPEADNTNLLTVWVAVTEATEENGCLCLVPGSHRSELETHCLTVGVTIPESLIEEHQIKVPVPAGSVIFLHRLTKHGSLSNLSNSIRWSFDLRYQPIGQPTGIGKFPSTIVRSQQQPENVVTDWKVWADSWLSLRQKYAAEPLQQIKWHRWSGDDPVCG